MVTVFHADIVYEVPTFCLTISSIEICSVPSKSNASKITAASKFSLHKFGQINNDLAVLAAFSSAGPEHTKHAPQMNASALMLEIQAASTRINTKQLL